MHAVLRCPECGQPWKVPTEAFGKTVKGPCGHSFVAREELAAEAGQPPGVTAAPPKLQPSPRAEVPDEEVEERPAPRRRRESEEEEEYDDEPRRRSRRRPARSSGGRTALIVVGAVVGAVLLICGGITYIGYQFIKGVERAAKEIAKDFKNEFDKHPFGQDPGFGGGGVQGEVLAFGTPEEAMAAYVKAVLELDPATYQTIIAQDTNMRFEFKDRRDILARDSKGYDMTFLGKAVLNEIRGRWWDDRALLYPSQQQDDQTVTQRVVSKDRFASGHGQESVRAYEFRKAADGWYFSGSRVLGRANEIKDLAQVPAANIRPLVNDPTKLSALEFDLLADTRLPSPAEARATLTELGFGADLDAQGKLKQLSNTPHVDNKLLRCVYVLATPEFSVLPPIVTPELGDKDLGRLVQRLPKLKRFSTINLSGAATQLTDKGLAPLSKLTHLAELELHAPLVSDAGLAALASLDKLEALSFEGCISDGALSHLGKLKKLAVLKLNRNRITGPGLGHLKELNQLFSIQLRENLLAGSGLELLAALPKLQSLDVSHNRITDKGLERVAGVTVVEILNLDGNQITDAGLQHLKGLSKLRWLYLGDNQIQGAGLSHLKGLKNLVSIRLEENPLTDEAVEALAQLPQLRSVSLSQGNRISEAALAKLRRAVPEVQIRK
jgi:Leucine-rich repeat (LRR) protein